MSGAAEHIRTGKGYFLPLVRRREKGYTMFRRL